MDFEETQLLCRDPGLLPTPADLEPTHRLSVADLQLHVLAHSALKGCWHTGPEDVALQTIDRGALSSAVWPCFLEAFL